MRGKNRSDWEIPKRFTHGDNRASRGISAPTCTNTTPHKTLINCTWRLEITNSILLLSITHHAPSGTPEAHHLETPSWSKEDGT